MVQREVQAKLKEVKLEKAHLAVAIDRMSRVMSSAGLSLAVFDKDAGCVMATPSARAVLGREEGRKLDDELKAFLSTEEARSSYAREAFLKRQPPDKKALYEGILKLFDHSILDDDGDLMGVIFRRNPDNR